MDAENAFRVGGAETANANVPTVEVDAVEERNRFGVGGDLGVERGAQVGGRVGKDGGGGEK